MPLILLSSILWDLELRNWFKKRTLHCNSSSKTFVPKLQILCPLPASKSVADSLVSLNVGYNLSSLTTLCVLREGRDACARMCLNIRVLYAHAEIRGENSMSCSTIPIINPFSWGPSLNLKTDWQS